MPSCRPLRAALGLVLLATSGLARQDDGPYDPEIKPASGDAELARQGFQVADGLEVELVASEPLLANPVIFCIDEKGRFYIAETFRHHAGVTDMREHMGWLDEDLAAKTVADRLHMMERHEGEAIRKYATEHERVRRLEDRDGDGKVDYSVVYADGFQDVADGIAAGLLARRGDVYFTCIPSLWKLRDTDGDGRADEREELQTGYGVRISLLGHDLHGLCIGPDGRLYFSIGDRGLHVETEDGVVSYPPAGAVLRCELDGSKLELFATGLRNPQELVFDEHGNLFTGDNNSDGGDQARWVYVMHGSDSGWRYSYQWLEGAYRRGPWNHEKLWWPHFEGQAAYIVPPIDNIANGPSGLTYYPGTGLNPSFEGSFFLADFRGGAAISGVHTFRNRAKGAGFELVDRDRLIWNVLVTDVDFGYDGSVYLTDWIQGWNQPKAGRLYRILDPERRDDEGAMEVKRLFAAGFESRPEKDLVPLLEHPDRRVRQEAQFALVEQGRAARLSEVARRSGAPLARLHALWGLGQLQRLDGRTLAGMTDLLEDPDFEVRAQMAKLVGDCGIAGVAPALVSLLKDDSPRVRSFAAISLGQLGTPEIAIDPLLALAGETGETDPWLRHACVMGLSGLEDLAPLIARAGDGSLAARMAILLVLRRKERPEVALFLGDREPAIVLEAARAIHDVPIRSAFPMLAGLADRSSSRDEALWRRVISACFELHDEAHAEAVARLAARSELSARIRSEAFAALGNWSSPSGRDRVMGSWRPFPPVAPQAGAEALGRIAGDLLAESDMPPELRTALVEAIGRCELEDFAGAIAQLVESQKESTRTRIAGLEVLGRFRGEGDRKELVRTAQGAALKACLADEEARVRSAGTRLLAQLDPDRAVSVLEEALRHGRTIERQTAYRALGDLKNEAADRILKSQLDSLLRGDVPEAVRLDLIEAAEQRESKAIEERLARYRASKAEGDPIAEYRESLLGGDAARGRRIFEERSETRCLRCHVLGGAGGEESGPDLSAVGNRLKREEILRSILEPNAAIADGFETVVIFTKDDLIYSGRVLSEKDGVLKLETAKKEILEIPVTEIDTRGRGLSSMPDNLEDYLSRSDLRDLVEFLSNQKADPDQK
ncbi:MAG: HEAT repeat domain-containing protein [Planctomycetota bacterium]